MDRCTETLTEWLRNDGHDAIEFPEIGPEPGKRARSASVGPGIDLLSPSRYPSTPRRFRALTSSTPDLVPPRIFGTVSAPLPASSATLTLISPGIAVSLDPVTLLTRWNAP